MTLAEIESFAHAESIDLDAALTQAAIIFYWKGRTDAVLLDADPGGVERHPPEDLLSALTTDPLDDLEALRGQPMEHASTSDGGGGNLKRLLEQ